MISSAGQTISSLLGIVYTAAWSLSFYPQAILNFRRKSVQGLSIDFLYLNPLGFACYTAFSASMIFSQVIRGEYRERHRGHEPSVRWNDLAFAAHAFAISSFTAVQSFVYKRDTTQHSSRFNRLFITLALIAIFLFVFAVSLDEDLEWLDLVYFLSYVKLYISFAKYIPQAWQNYKRKSTIGWSIENICLDFTGGVLSLGQLVLDAWLSDDWKAITGNPGKLGLSFLSIAFDIVFLVQHFILYRNSNSTLLDPHGQEGERRPLLGDEEDPGEAA